MLQEGVIVSGVRGGSGCDESFRVKNLGFKDSSDN